MSESESRKALWESVLDGTAAADPSYPTGGYDDYDANSVENTPEPAPEAERDWHFTFGMGHVFRNRYITFHGTFMGARQQMAAVFGNEWAFQYDDSEKAASIDKYSMEELKVTDIA